MAFMIGGVATTDVANAQWFKNLGGFGSRPVANPIPIAFQRPPSQAEYLIWQQRHAAGVKQLDAKIQVALTGTPKLRGTIQMEVPRRLRLKAGVLGMNEMGVDVGSNDELFWIWTRVALPGQSPTLMYANHEQFERSTGAIRQAVPLEPEWLMDALGLADFSKYESHSEPVQQPGGRMKIISGRATANGKQYRVTLFDAMRGIIEQQSLYDQRGTLIAYTDMSKYRYYPEHGVSLPGKINMHLFQNGQEVTLAVTTDNYKINALYGDPALMWSMPNPAGVQKINLAPQEIGQSRPPLQKLFTSAESTASQTMADAYSISVGWVKNEL